MPLGAVFMQPGDPAQGASMQAAARGTVRLGHELAILGAWRLLTEAPWDPVRRMRRPVKPGRQGIRTRRASLDRRRHHRKPR